MSIWWLERNSLEKGYSGWKWSKWRKGVEALDILEGS